MEMSFTTQLRQIHNTETLQDFLPRSVTCQGQTILAPIVFPIQVRTVLPHLIPLQSESR